jgi:DNA-binding MarR family transcriptional regulator
VAVHRQPVASADVSSSDLREFTGFLLRLAYVRAVGAERSCMPDDGHVGEMTVLSVLAEHGAVSQRELSDITSINPTVTVRQVDAIEARGWVVRDRNPADRRSYALRLTPAGHAALLALSRDLDRAEADLTSALSLAETRRLKRRLTELLVDDPLIAVGSLAERAGFLIARAHRTVRGWAEPQLAILGIHPPHFGVLAVVGREQPCSQSLVATRMRITAPAVLGFIDELEAAGLLQRSRNDADRRSNDVVLTAPGRTCLAAAMAVGKSVQEEIVRRLGSSGEAELRSLLRKLIA